MNSEMEGTAVMEENLPPTATNTLKAGPSRLPIWCLLVCILFACVAFSWNSYCRLGSDDQDAINYQSAAHCMMDNWSYMKWRFPYEQINDNVKIFNGYYPYPNYAYLLTVGVLGHMRQIWDVSNGMIVSLIFSIGFTILCSLMMYRLSRHAGLTFLFALALNFTPIVRNVAILPMTDVCLMFFFILAVLWAVTGRMLLSGIALGLGFLYRGQAVLFLPFLPLVWLGCRSPKDYIKSGFWVGLGFLPAFCLNYGLKHVLSKGLPIPDFYSEGFFNKILPGLLQPDNLARIPKFSVNVIIEHSFLFFPVLAFMLDPRRLSPQMRRFTLISLLNGVMMVVMWSWYPMLPFRYFVYFVPLLLMVLYIDFSNARHPMLSGLVLTAFILLFPFHGLRDILKLNPRQQMATLRSVTFRYQDVDRSLFTNDIKAIATTDFSLMPLYSSQAVPVTLPALSAFIEGKANHRIDMLLISSRQEHDAAYNSWGGAPERIKDGKGNVFVRVPTPTPDLVRVYLRGDLYQKYQAHKPGLPPYLAAGQAGNSAATPVVAPARPEPVREASITDRDPLSLTTTTLTSAIMAQEPIDPKFTEGWQTLSSYEGGRIKMQIQPGKSITINLADENPHQGDFVGIKRTLATIPGKQYEFKVILEDSYSEDHPGRLAGQVRLNGDLLWIHDIGKGTYAGNILLTKKFTAQRAGTEVSIELRAIGPIDPWHWGFQSLGVLGFACNKMN